LASEVHAVPADFFVSGHVALVPVQVSPTSHSPPEARHDMPAVTFVHAVLLTLGWQDWQLFGAVFF